jgi:hypothetical protein
LHKKNFQLFFRIVDGCGMNAGASVHKPIPALAVCLVPVNYVSRVTGWIAFDDPVRCRPQTRLVSQMASFQFKVQVANHEQGRVNLPAKFNQRAG